jgi:hypothetical protein
VISVLHLAVFTVLQQREVQRDPSDAIKKLLSMYLTKPKTICASAPKQEL